MNVTFCKVPLLLFDWGRVLPSWYRHPYLNGIFRHLLLRALAGILGTLEDLHDRIGYKLSGDWPSISRLDNIHE